MKGEKFEGIDYKRMYSSLDPKTQMRVENEVDRRMKTALDADKQAVENRRERLKGLKLEEFKVLEQINHLQAGQEEKKFEMMKRRILEIELRRERDRKEFVERKRAQQKFSNCEPIRIILSKQQEKAIRNDQWWQIKERIKTSKQSQKDNEYYQQIMLQNVQEAMKLEAENRAKKWQKELEVKDGYMQQMEEKKKALEKTMQEKNEERLQLQLERDRIKEKEKNDLSIRKQKIEKLDVEMREMIAMERARRQRRIEEERKMADEIDFIASSHKSPDKSDFKREMDSYLEALRSLTAKRREEEKLFDEKLAELVQEREKRQNIEMKKLQAARTELARTVFKGREGQVTQKIESEKLAKESASQERQQLLRDAQKLASEIENDRRKEIEKKQKYAEELRQQINERQQRQLKEKQDAQDERAALVTERVKLEEELKELTVNPPDWHSHPLHGVNCATHYIAHN